ncbi:MAG: DUF423 domain-containing protein [Pseudomonadota bacterium]
MKNWFLWGGFFALLSVVLGAFGAHGLEKTLSKDKLEVFMTATDYMMMHGFGLLFLGLRKEMAGVSFVFTGFAFLAGIFLFSGSLYVYVLGNLRWAAMITPLGGTAFIVGWAAYLKQEWGLQKST